MPQIIIIQNKNLLRRTPWEGLGDQSGQHRWHSEPFQIMAQ